MPLPFPDAVHRQRQSFLRLPRCRQNALGVATVWRIEHTTHRHPVRQGDFPAHPWRRRNRTDEPFHIRCLQSLQTIASQSLPVPAAVNGEVVPKSSTTCRFQIRLRPAPGAPNCAPPLRQGSATGVFAIHDVHQTSATAAESADTVTKVEPTHPATSTHRGELRTIPCSQARPEPSPTSLAD